MTGHVYVNRRKTKPRLGPWANDAACRGTDPNLFFPNGTTGADAEKIKEAKAICATCSVWAPCLEEALTHNDDGIWGGTTEEERRKIRRRRRLAARKAKA